MSTVTLLLLSLASVSVKALICPYGGYCTQSSDCSPGYVCNVHSQYSICNPDPVIASTCEYPEKFHDSYTPGSICPYGGFCKLTADCSAGYVCSTQSDHYSQCIPDPAVAATCVHPSGFTANQPGNTPS